MNSTIDLLKSHTSIRKFNDQVISKEVEETILQCAMRGATAGNMMYYHMIVIRDKEVLESLGESCDHQPFIGKAQFALLFLVDNYKWSEYFSARGVTDHGDAYKGPQLPDLILGMQDAMIAAQNSVIAAESLGIGTCYIGDILENAELYKAQFNLPDYTMPATLVVMGHYDGKPKLRKRFASKYVISQEKYPLIDDDFINGMFMEAEHEKKDFAQKFYSRKVEAEFFKEMKRSIKVHIKQWFKV